MKSIFPDKSNAEFWEEFKAAPQSGDAISNLNYVIRAFENSETFTIDSMITEHMDGEELVGIILQVQENMAMMYEEQCRLQDEVMELSE